MSQKKIELLLTDEEIIQKAEPYTLRKVGNIHRQIAKAQLAKAQAYFQPCAPDCITYVKILQSEKKQLQELNTILSQSICKHDCVLCSDSIRADERLKVGTILARNFQEKDSVELENIIANLKSGKSPKEG